MQEEREGPWLVSINPFSAHDPFDYLPEFFDRYDPDSLPSPVWREGELDGKPWYQRHGYEDRGGPAGYAGTTDRQRREMKAAYYATIEHIDAEFGRLLDWLEQTGELENTLVIFNADHGDMGGDHGLFQKGAYLYDPAIRVPLILSWPGHIASGRVTDALVEQVDIVPTIHELLGMPIPERVQGRSLLPLLTGEKTVHDFREGVYCEYYNSNPIRTEPEWQHAYATMWRTRQHKIVVYHGDELGELYDLEKDPNEFENRWNDPDYRDIRCDLMKRCFDARAFTMDPLPVKTAGF
jgi:arylsulfatase A-like enzyme